MRPTRNTRRGSQAVEFALVLPVLLLLTAGIVDYGWFYSNQLAMINAAREGGRAGAAADPADGQDYCTEAENRVIAALLDAGITATATDVTASTSGADPDIMLTVFVSRPYTGLFSLVPVPSQIYGQVTMRVENQDDTATCSS